MDLRFWLRPTSRLLPKDVQHAVVSQFSLDPLAVDNLRYVGKSGQFAGRRVHYFRLYDPDLISHGAGDKVGYDQLQLSSDLKALQFQGHIEKDGTVYLTDRRPVTPGPKAVAA